MIPLFKNNHLILVQLMHYLVMTNTVKWYYDMRYIVISLQQLQNNTFFLTKVNHPISKSKAHLLTVKQR